MDVEIRDLSEGGAFVHGSVPLALGERLLIEIRFIHQNTQGQKTGEVKITDYSKLIGKLGQFSVTEASVVRWARGSSTTGFGVEFLSPSEETRALLRMLIQYAEATAQKEEEEAAE